MHLLILGAGASVDYNYPTGNQMLTNIRSVLTHPNRNTITVKQKIHPPGRTTEKIPIINYLNPIFQDYRITNSEIKKFTQLITSSKADSIDIILARENNSQFDNIGKTLIAFEIMRHESNAHKGWYDSLLSSLTGVVPLWKMQDFQIITFNYDRSLECTIFEHLLNYYLIQSDDKMTALSMASHEFSRLKIKHMYGAIDSTLNQFKGKVSMLDKFYKPYGDFSQSLSTEYDEAIKLLTHAAASIQTIYQAQHSEKDQAEILQMIESSTEIHFIGFGFHELNIKSINNLNLVNRIDALRLRQNQLFACNHGLSIRQMKTINNTISTVNFSDPNMDSKTYFIQYLK